MALDALELLMDLPPALVGPGDRHVVRATGRGAGWRPGDGRPAVPLRPQDPHDGRLRADRRRRAGPLPARPGPDPGRGLPSRGARAAQGRALASGRVAPGPRGEGRDRPPVVGRPRVGYPDGRDERPADSGRGAQGDLGPRGGPRPPAAAAAAARAFRARVRRTGPDRRRPGARRGGVGSKLPSAARSWQMRSSRPRCAPRTGRSSRSTWTTFAASASSARPTRCSRCSGAASRAGRCRRCPTGRRCRRAAR